MCVGGWGGGEGGSEKGILCSEAGRENNQHKVKHSKTCPQPRYIKKLTKKCEFWGEPFHALQRRFSRSMCFFTK